MIKPTLLWHVECRLGGRHALCILRNTSSITRGCTNAMSIHHIWNKRPQGFFALINKLLPQTCLYSWICSRVNLLILSVCFHTCLISKYRGIVLNPKIVMDASCNIMSSPHKIIWDYITHRHTFHTQIIFQIMTPKDPTWRTAGLQR